MALSAGAATTLWPAAHAVAAQVAPSATPQDQLIMGISMNNKMVTIPAARTVSPRITPPSAPFARDMPADDDDVWAGAAMG